MTSSRRFDLSPASTLVDALRVRATLAAIGDLWEVEVAKAAHGQLFAGRVVVKIGAQMICEAS